MSDHSGPHRAADPGAALIASPGGKRKGVKKMSGSKVEMSPLSHKSRPLHDAGFMASLELGGQQKVSVIPATSAASASRRLANSGSVTAPVCRNVDGREF